MIQMMNSAKRFFENNEDILYIYGAGNPGKWVAEYMMKCEINFEGFIDKANNIQDCCLFGKRVIHPNELKQYGDKRLRIILAVGNPREALADLHCYAMNNNLICLAPLYPDFVRLGESNTQNSGLIYDINELLSYFRGRLFIGEVPTILSNSCGGV